MDQSALLELLEALKAAGVDDRIRVAAQSMYQALIDAEAEGVIGAGFWERTENRTAVRWGSPRFRGRVPFPGAVNDVGGSGVADPEVADRVVLPESAGASVLR